MTTHATPHVTHLRLTWYFVTSLRNTLRGVLHDTAHVAFVLITPPRDYLSARLSVCVTFPLHDSRLVWLSLRVSPFRFTSANHDCYLDSILPQLNMLFSNCVSYVFGVLSANICSLSWPWHNYCFAWFTYLACTAWFHLWDKFRRGTMCWYVNGYGFISRI